MMTIGKTHRRTPDQLPKVKAIKWRINIGRRHWIPYYWELMEDVRVWVPILSNWVTIFKGFDFDKTSVSVNLRDYLPSLVHDFLYANRIMEDGTALLLPDRSLADICFFWLNESSWLPYARFAARHRFSAVVIGGPYVWARRRMGDPIPDHAVHLYGAVPFNP